MVGRNLLLATLLLAPAVVLSQGIAKFAEVEVRAPFASFNDAVFLTRLSSAMNLAPSRVPELLVQEPGVGAVPSTVAGFWILPGDPVRTPSAVLADLVDATRNTGSPYYNATHQSDFFLITANEGTPPSQTPPPPPGAPPAPIPEFDPLAAPWLFVIIGGAACLLILVGACVAVGVWRKKKNDAAWY